jgi:hypothetical protein
MCVSMDVFTGRGTSAHTYSRIPAGTSRRWRVGGGGGVCTRYSRGTARVLDSAAAARPHQPTRTHIYTRVTPTAARTCAGGRAGVQGHGMKRYSKRYSSTGTQPGYSRRSSGVLYSGSRVRRVMCYATFGCGHVTAAKAWVLAWVLGGFFYAAPEYVRARCRSLRAALCL